MSVMTDFCSWFLNQLPEFLMSEPMCYFVAFFFLFVTVKLVQRIINLG